MKDIFKEFKPSSQVLSSYSLEFDQLVALGRSGTSIGQQGDHVSAYHLIESLAT